jgi:hypothetical protein
MANVRDDEQKPHIRLSLRASWHNTTKPTGSGDEVNAAFVRGKFTSLSGEICVPCDRIALRESGTGQPGNQAQAYPSAVSGYEFRYRETRNRQHLRVSPIAPGMETWWVSAQKSADGIVVSGNRNEGQNGERRKGIP